MSDKKDEKQETHEMPNVRKETKLIEVKNGTVYFLGQDFGVSVTAVLHTLHTLAEVIGILARADQATQSPPPPPQLEAVPPAEDA